MKIVLDGSDAVVGTRAIRRYAINLISQLTTNFADDQFKIFLNYFRGNSDVIDRKIENRKNASKIRYSMPRHLSLPLWNMLNFPPVDWFTGKADIFHSLGDDCPPVKCAAYIMTLHGIVYMTRPDLIDPDYVRKKRQWLRKMTKRADYFVSVSESTKQEFLSFFGFIDPERVRVIPLGIGSEFRVLAEKRVKDTLLHRFNLTRPYILYAGGLEAHKNIKGIIQSFSLLASQFPELDLILVGNQNGKTRDIADLIDRLRLNRRTKILNYVSQEDDSLSVLYNGAECFIFPSFSEGWTSPPLEAMACGTPVVTSNLSSLPETVGDSALLVDPYKIEAICSALNRLLSDSELHATMRQKGLHHASQYTWQSCAASTYLFYKEIASSV